MCASVSHGATAVINGATRVNPINGEPPGTNVQTNLAEQGVSKTKPALTKPQNPIASAVTPLAKMGNQQGSEGGKNQQGSKKREKKDTSQSSKSNSPNSEATSRKSKSPSVKKKSSPGSPSKKVFKKKQPPVNQDPTGDVAKAKGATAADQQCTQDVFTDARETMSGAGKSDRDKTEKLTGDSSSDNISFESVSCGTPLRVATPRVQRAQSKAETLQHDSTHLVDSVDELGKCIERAIMERFSDVPSVALELNQQSESKTCAEAASKDVKNFPDDDINVSMRCEGEGKSAALPTSCKAPTISDTPDISPPTVDGARSQEISKSIRKIKIEPMCSEQAVDEKTKADTTKDTSDNVEISNMDKCSVCVSKDTSIVTPSAVENVGTDNNKPSASVSKDTNTITPSAAERVGIDNGKSSASVSKDTNIVTASALDHAEIDNDKSSASVSEDKHIATPAVDSVSVESITTIAQSGTKHVDSVSVESITTIAQSGTKHVDSKNPSKILLDATRPSHPTEDIEMSSTSAAKSEGIFERDVEPQIPETKRDIRVMKLQGKETKDKESVKNPIDEVLVNSPEQSAQIPHFAPDAVPGDFLSDTVTAADNSHLRFSEKSDTESSDVNSPVTDISEDSQTPLFISEPDIIKAEEDINTELIDGNSESIRKESYVAEAQPISYSDKHEAVKPRSLPARRWPAADTKSAIEQPSRSMTLAEKRQHRLTDPLVDTLLLLIKRTMESDDIDSSTTTNIPKTGHSKKGNNPVAVKPQQVPVQGKSMVKSVTKDGTEDEDADKTLTPEDMVEFERLKQKALVTEESTNIGGMDDDTLTQEDLEEFNRLKKEMSKDTRAGNDETFPLHVEDRFELSSGETTEDSVIEKPVQKAPGLETTKEDNALESQVTPRATSTSHEPKPEDVLDSPEIRSDPIPESPVVRKRSLTEDEIRREIRRFMIPEMKESLPSGGSMKQMLHDLHDITPTSEFYPSMEDRDSTDSPEPGNSSGVRSRTSITSSELDISEQRDDMSTGTDSMYADDEDDSSSEVLFCKTYTEPVQGAEVLVSCTVVNSALKEANSSSDEFWAENSAAEDAYQQAEFAAAAVNHHFTHARSQMQDIQHHLQALKFQMRDMEKQVVKTNIQPTDEFAFDGPERRAVTD